jgi:hypothetical protein
LEDCVEDSLLLLSHQQRCNLHDIDSKLAHAREATSLSQLKAHSQSPPALSNDNLLALSTEDPAVRICVGIRICVGLPDSRITVLTLTGIRGPNFFD